jgi:hypothetical protein
MAVKLFDYWYDFRFNPTRNLAAMLKVEMLLLL